jgi:flagellar biosynthesis chaperone FliJ
LQYQEEVILSTFRKDGDDKILDYANLLKENDILKKELEKANSNYNQTTNKLRHNVAKRRRLEVWASKIQAKIEFILLCICL